MENGMFAYLTIEWVCMVDVKYLALIDEIDNDDRNCLMDWDSGLWKM